MTKPVRNVLIRLTSDSRYKLLVNGKRKNWGPAPCDPRQWDVDTVDITDAVLSGENVIGVEVLYYGFGDGTYVMGAPGLIAGIEIEYQDGTHEMVPTDRNWQVCVDRAHPPGIYRRWFLRAMQEHFDARLHQSREFSFTQTRDSLVRRNDGATQRSF